MSRDTIIEEIFFATESMHRAWKGLTHAIIGEQNISPTQVYALFMLESRQPIQMKEFAQVMQFTPGAVTQIIDSLGGYVDRTHDTKDRRIVHLSLSKNGEKFMSKLKQQRKAFFKQVVEIFSDNELQHMLAHQQKMLAQIEQMQSNAK